MSQYQDTGYKAFPTGALIGQFLRVKLVAGVLQLAGLSDRGLGTSSRSNQVVGDPISVILRSKQGTTQYIASGAIPAGSDVFTDANGLVSGTQAPGSFHLGTALEAAAQNGDIIEVLNVSGGTNIGPANITFAIAAGAAASNICNVTLQVVDSNGNNVAGVFDMDVILSDAATGAGLTATTASGTVVGTTGADLGDLTAKKAKRVQTDATGKYVLQITDTGKTHFYVAAVVPGRGNTVVSAQLQTANYG